MGIRRLIDGEGITLELGKPFRLGCCDCGLTHDVVVVTLEEEPGFFGLALSRNMRCTSARRRYMGKDALRTLFRL